MEGVSRDWKTFMDTNREYIYRNAAKLHRFAPANTTLLPELTPLYAKRAWPRVNGWKSFCR